MLVSRILHVEPRKSKSYDILFWISVHSYQEDDVSLQERDYEVFLSEYQMLFLIELIVDEELRSRRFGQ